MTNASYHSGDIGICIVLQNLPFEEASTIELLNETIATYNTHNLVVKSNPITKILWNATIVGKYDLASIILIDDFEFAARVIRPTMNSSPGQIGNNDFKILHGTFPLKSFQDNIEERIAKIQESQYPIIGITQIKINNSLIIGGGLKILDAVSDLIKSKSKSCDFLLLESFSSNELNVIWFANSVVDINGIVNDLRSSKYCELVELDFNGNTLLSSFHEKFGTQTTSFNHNHVFENTRTSYGCIRNSNERPIVERELIYNYWRVKPGHEERLVQILKKNDFKNISLTSGRTDLISQFKGKGNHFLEDYFKVLKDNKIELDKHCYNVDSIITYASTYSNAKGLKIFKFDEQEHFDYQNKLELFKLDADKKKQFVRNLNEAQVPYVLSRKVIKILDNFDNMMLDPNLYTYYLELYDFINNVLFYNVKVASDRLIIKSADDFDSFYLMDFYENLEFMIENLELAYENRFFKSYKTHEMSDIKSDYSGGIQNLLSGYDSAYKCIKNLTKLKSKSLLTLLPGMVEDCNNFIYCSGHSGIRSNEHSLKINYIHLFQPSVFFAMIFHEGSNFFIEKISNQLTTLKSQNIDLGYFEGYESLCSYFCDNHEYDNSYLRPIFDSHLEHKDYFDYYMTTIIEDNVLRYFSNDLFTFYYGYNSDFELFEFWHWNHIFQMGLYKTTDDIVSKHLFLVAQFRINLLYEWVNRNGEFNDVKRMDFIGSDALMRYYRRNKIPLSIFIKHIVDLKLKFFSQMDGYIKSLCLRSNDGSFTEIDDGLINSKFDKWQTSLVDPIKKAESIFGNGTVYNSIEFEEDLGDEFTHDSKFIQSCTIGYLNLIKGMFDMSKPFFKDKDSYWDSYTEGALYFDSRGGVQGYDSASRRALFKFRSSFFKTLWHQCQHLKLERIQRVFLSNK